MSYFFFRNANYKFSRFLSNRFTHLKGNRDFRFIFFCRLMGKPMHGRRCAQQYM